MRLRSISKNLKAQNWFAVWLDFFIVVLGVFIGIQLGNWNDARGDRAAEVDYLKRYHADLSATSEMFETRLQSIGQQLGEIGKAAELPNNTQRAWEIIRAQYVISGFTPPEIRTATYADMVSSGRLELITDQDLRSSLVEHYSRNAALPILESEPPFRQMVRGIIPYALQDYLTSSSCLVDFVTYVPCPPPSDAENLIQIATVLTGDVELKRARNYNIAHHKISRNIIASLMIQTDELREDVGAALEDKGQAILPRG